MIENKTQQSRALGLQELRTYFGARACSDEAVLRQHSCHLTEFGIVSQPPDLVVFPRDEAEVVDAVEICARFGLPIVAYGAGTSLEGQVNAPQGGVAIDLARLDKIVDIDVQSMTATVQPGISRTVLDAALTEHGLFFPVDPALNATIGGMVATRASGSNAVRYGTMRENTLGLRAVLADGSVIQTGGKARKSAAGYDLTRLLVGSEGTLGIIVEATVLLAPLPEASYSARASFLDLRDACETVMEARRAGLCLARIELLDALQIAACNSHSQLSLPEQPSLFVEFHGSALTVADDAGRFAALVARRSGATYEGDSASSATSPIWLARRQAYWAARALRPDCAAISTDVCVPVSRLADMVVDTQADLEELSLTAPIAGHVGDGNFHALLLVDNDDPGEIARAKVFLGRLVTRAIAAGGTCSGEHGIGQSKKAYLPLEFGNATLNAMRAIKHALDPLGIMNPGKVFDPRHV